MARYTDISTTCLKRTIISSKMLLQFAQFSINYGIAGLLKRKIEKRSNATILHGSNCNFSSLMVCFIQQFQIDDLRGCSMMNTIFLIN